MNNGCAHLLHVFPSFAGGGPEVRTADIINRSTNRFRHTILSLSGDVSGRERLADAEAVACMPVAGSSLWSLARAIRSHRPNLILTYGWGGTDAIAAARLAGIGRVVHAEDGFLDDEIARQKWKRRWARRLVFQAARLLVVPSLALCGVARQTWGVAESRLRYIPNGIDLARFQPPTEEQRAQARHRYGFSEDSIVIGIVGALRPEKNQLRLLKAFAQVAREGAGASLLIVGDGPQMPQLQEAAGASGVAERVVFAGTVRDTSPMYHAMDVLGLSSDTEQMPLSILEGMASGLPVVSTDVGDVREMICDANRRFVAPCDQLAVLSQAIAALAADPTLRRRLGEANRARCEAEFGSERMLSSYFKLYDEFAMAS
jgi:glycosyltransferase involved in cell wall biosynthesis